MARGAKIFSYNLLALSEKQLYSFVDDLLHVQQCMFTKNTLKYSCHIGRQWFLNIFFPFYTPCIRTPKRTKQICNFFTRCTWEETCNILLRESAFVTVFGFLHNHFLLFTSTTRVILIVCCFTVLSNSCSGPGRDRCFWKKNRICPYLVFSLSWSSRSRGPDSCSCWPCTW